MKRYAACILVGILIGGVFGAAIFYASIELLDGRTEVSF